MVPLTTVDLTLNHVRANGCTDTGAAPCNLVVDGEGATILTAISAVEMGGRIPIPNLLGRFTAGVDLLNSTNWDLRIQYTAKIGDGYTSHTGLERIAYRF